VRIAIGPVIWLVTMPTRPTAARTTRTTSPIRRARADVAGGTRLSSDAIGSRSTGRAAAYTTAREAIPATTVANGTCQPSSKGTPGGRMRRRTSSLSPTAISRPSGRPRSTVRPSSAMTSRRLASRLRPRSRDTAISGRRCATAAPATSTSTASATATSWAMSSGTS